MRSEDSVRILVGADYSVARAGLRAMVLEAEGLDLVGECRLDELSAHAAELRPDVALIDLTADDHDGAESVWRLVTELPDLATVVLSGDPTETLAREALQMGVRGYLLRDVSPEEIVEAIRAAHLGLTVLHPAAVRSLLSGPEMPVPASAADPLTARELEVLQALAQGLPSKTIASRLRISEHTVKFHVGSILGKLGAASRTEAVSIAIRRGLIAL